MNLYKYHSEPNSLDECENRLTIVPELAYKYALETNQRFEAGEPAIIKNPRYAYSYAAYIMNSRWPEAELVIMKNPLYWNYYTNHFGLRIR